LSTPGTNHHSECGPQVYSTDLALHTSILSTGWQSALRRPPVLKVVQLVPSFSKPHAVSMILGRDAVSVSSFLLAPPGSDSTETQFGGTGQAASRSAFDSDDGPNAIPITSDTTVGRPSGTEKIGPVSLKPTAGRTRIHPPPRRGEAGRQIVLCPATSTGDDAQWTGTAVPRSSVFLSIARYRLSVSTLCRHPG